MRRTREEWNGIERDARRQACRVLATADPGLAWREAGYASPRQAAAALIDAAGVEPGTGEAVRSRTQDILAGVFGAFGGTWAEAGPTPPPPDAPPVSVTLGPGEYLVQVQNSDPLSARVWTHQGNGVFVGHGGKVRKVAIIHALSELVRAAEIEEGVDRW